MLFELPTAPPLRRQRDDVELLAVALLGAAALRSREQFLGRLRLPLLLRVVEVTCRAEAALEGFVGQPFQPAPAAARHRPISAGHLHASRRACCHFVATRSRRFGRNVSPTRRNPLLATGSAGGA